MRVQQSIEIVAPASRVWALTVDVEALPSLTPTMTRVERLDRGPLAVGSRVRIKQPGQPRRVWTVTSLEPQRRFAWSTKVMGATVTGTHELTESETGTTQTLTIDLEGPLARFIGPLVRRPIQKAIATENQGFKTAAEGGE